MCIYPEGPECVIQIEYHHPGKGQPIAESIWSNALLNEDAGVGWVDLLYRLFDHVRGRGQEQKSGQGQKRRYEKQRSGYYSCRCWEVVYYH